MGNTNSKKQANEKQLAYKYTFALLGIHSSGKSTILKQIRHIWGKQYLVNERKTFQRAIWHNIIRGMQILITQSRALSSNFNDCGIDWLFMLTYSTIIHHHNIMICAHRTTP